MSALLEIHNFSAGIEEKKILDGVSLAINAGEIHFLMGSNGSGKTTLAAAVMGSPIVVSTGGTIAFNGEDITTTLPEDRAKKG
ncbi:MAG: Fe-S cluster assembly ATP-binding protein, partial [Parcubacteria group bacterium Greene0714_36]